MFERLSSSESSYRESTQKHINEYADAGLRTLVLAYCQLDDAEYAKFDKKFTAAKNSVSADRDELIEEAADSLERGLILLGATAVEDKLQKGVPECIDKLAQAGIKIWVLTGDKMETAINIGYTICPRSFHANSNILYELRILYSFSQICLQSTQTRDETNNNHTGYTRYHCLGERW
jgi:magnesium-transporting ATPase (P-type)